jgi:hypothetical protein
VGIASLRDVVVELPDLAAGSYDVVLWDYKQEMGRLSAALNVVPLAPTPTLEMQVKGTFKDLPPPRLNMIKPGDQFPPAGTAVATVVSVDAPRASEMQIRAGLKMLTVPVSGKTDLPGVLRVTCFTVSDPDGSMRCAVTGPAGRADVAPGSFLSLPGADGWIAFQISEVLASAGGER